MIWLIFGAFVAIIVVYSIFRFREGETIIPSLVIIVIGAITALITYNIDISLRTTDIEMWSGSVTKVKHKEEWDEWHPPRTERVERKRTNSKGETETYTETIHHPGYWEHHYATNYIWTSDGGSFSISELPDGKIANDKYINTDAELATYYPIGMPTASFHTYKNKIKASYSIYKTNNVDESQYPDLPEYPSQTKNYVEIDRVIGFSGITKKSNDKLSEVNTYLNKQIPDPEKEGKMRSWKQVNIVIVNLGVNRPEDYGYALQNKWRNGSKNDVVISVSLDETGKVLWCHPFSWSDSKLFQLEIRDYISKLSLSNDDEMITMIDRISKMIEEGFVRKQFADFNYLKVEMSNMALAIIGVIYFFLVIGMMFCIEGQ